jgi:thiol:disulfide interchange protein DsbC
MSVLIRVLAASCLTVIAGSAARADGPPVMIGKDDLAKRYPEIDVRNIKEGPLPGFYEVTIGSVVSYVTTDGRFLFRGDIVDLDSRNNLTELRRSANRAALLATIDPAKEIVFSPANGEIKHRVTVFTDVDCGYCRQLHREIDAINALGIEVRYVSYPRTGPDTESWAKAEKVWCAADRKAALTRAKLGADVAAAPDCKNAPIAEEYDLGRRMGLTGTPGVYSDTGVDLGGYSAPQELLARLERAAAQPH